MQLEVVELRCMTYLQQVTNAIVPFSRLLAYVRQFPECGDVGEQELAAFLKDHELFKIFDPLPMDPAEARALGILTEHRVMLSTRVPTRKETILSMLETLETMATALTTAVREANERGDITMRHRAEVLLRRLEKLRENITAQS